MCARIYIALQGEEDGRNSNQHQIQHELTPKSTRRKRTGFPAEQKQELCCWHPNSHWSQDAAHMLWSLLEADWHDPAALGCSASLAGNSCTGAAVTFSPSLEGKPSLSPAAGTGPAADTDSSHFESPNSDIPWWTRRSDALQRTRVARNSSVVSSLLLFISLLGSSLFSSGTSHSLVLDVFRFFGRPVSCLRSAAGTKLEMGCNLAAHPGKQRHPTCLDITLQLQRSLPCSYLLKLQAWVQMAGEGEKCHSL